MEQDLRNVDEFNLNQNHNIIEPNNEEQRLDYSQAKSLFQIIASSFKIYRLGFVNIVSTSAILSIPILLMTHLILLLLGESITDNSPYQYFTNFVEDFGKIIIASALIHCVCQYYLSSKISVSKAYTAVIQRIFSIVQIATIVSLALALMHLINIRLLLGLENADNLANEIKASGGDQIAINSTFQSNFPTQDLLISLIALVLFFILSVYLINIINSIVVDGLNLNHAINQTKNLLKNNWWRTSGIILTIFCLGSIGEFLTITAIRIPMFELGLQEAISSQLLYEITFCLLILPLMVISLTHLFFDLKARKESSAY